MEALKFDVYGKNAHFKNPETNNALELSYENIPKTVLVGFLGAILGLRGRQYAAELGFIEYWEQLKGCKIAVIPHKPRWGKHIEEMNNTTCFYNEKQNYTVRRQILENVRWTIYLLRDGISPEHFNNIKERLLSRISDFPLYLGKMENKARLGTVSVVNLEKIDNGNVEHCDSLINSSYIVDVDNIKMDEHFLGDMDLFFRNDYMPCRLNKFGLYEFEKLCFTNSYISVNQGSYYKDGSLILNIL